MKITSTVLTATTLSFVAGALFTRALTRIPEVHAKDNRVFELMVYHTLPGKVPELESIFRDVSNLQTKHNLNVLGYWKSTEEVTDKAAAWKDTFVYVVAHPSREAAEANWRALHADPAFLPYRAAAAPLIRKENGFFQVDEVYMRPSEFSPLQ